MNIPVAPTVDLAGLAHLRPSEKPLQFVPKRKHARSAAVIGAGGALVAAGALAWRFVPLFRPAKRTTTKWMVLGGVLAGFGLARWQWQRLFTAEPPHTIEERRGDLEIRRYAPFTVAHTEVDGAWDGALDEGFRRLASFIFGGNARKEHIAMTTPVMGARTERDAWRVQFMMPNDTRLPAPNDERVELEDLPPRRVAVMRFKGRYDEASVEAMKRTLVATAEDNGYVTRGEAMFAGYDPPSTLPFLRRNEVWIEIEG